LQKGLPFTSRNFLYRAVGILVLIGYTFYTVKMSTFLGCFIGKRIDPGAHVTSHLHSSHLAKIYSIYTFFNDKERGVWLLDTLPL
jgi:uncharacterized RmlC-like cupin family protein